VVTSQVASDGRQPSSLRALREARGWTQDAAVRHFLAVAQRLGISVGEPQSVRTSLSRWENHKRAPDGANRQVLRELYGRTDTEMGLVSGGGNERHDDDPDSVAARLRSQDRIDANLINLVAKRTDEFRLQDRRYGAALMFDQMSSHIDALKRMLSYSVMPHQRRALATVLADAGALAGWQALDAGAIARAWTYLDLARQAGAESGKTALLAHAMGEQAYALLELGDPVRATQLIDAAMSVGSLPLLLRVWLIAARGELLAAQGDAFGSQRSFDRAQRLLQGDARDDTLPFLALDDVHLARWRGNALARLGLPEAIPELTLVLDRLDATFVRARCAIHVDLALAYAQDREREAARHHIRTARELAQEVGSERLLRRLESIRIP
jgi:transcriptional regulator with XRE-family HTH domain